MDEKLYNEYLELLSKVDSIASMQAASQQIPDEYLNNKELFLDALEQNPDIIAYVDEAMFEDYEFVEECVKRDGMILADLPEHLTNDKNLVKLAMENDIRAYDYRGDELREDEELDQLLESEKEELGITPTLIEDAHFVTNQEIEKFMGNDHSRSDIEQTNGEMSDRDLKVQEEMQKRMQKQYDKQLRKAEKAVDRREKIDNIKENVAQKAETVKNVATNAKDATVHAAQTVETAPKAIIDQAKVFGENVKESNRVQLIGQKIELHKVDKDLKHLRKDLAKEMEIAVKQGMDPWESEKVMKISDEMVDLGVKRAGLLEEISDLKEKIQINKENNLQKRVAPIKKAFNKIKQGLETSVRSCYAGLGMLKEAAHEANEKFKTQGRTAYTVLSEKASSIHRGWLSLDHSISNSLAKHFNELHANLEQSYTRKATIRESVQNVWNAIRGKDQIEVTGQSRTSWQKGVLSQIDSWAKQMESDAKESAQKFAHSRENSISNILSKQELRQEMGLKESSSLSKAMEKAKNDFVKDAKTAEKSSHNKDNYER